MRNSRLVELLFSGICWKLQNSLILMISAQKPGQTFYFPIFTARGENDEIFMIYTKMQKYNENGEIPKLKTWGSQKIRF